MVAWRNAARDLHVNTLVVPWIFRHQLHRKLGPLRHAQRIVQADLCEAAFQALEMLAQTERLSAINRRDFVNAVAKHETAIEDGDFRLFARHELAVEIDRHAQLLINENIWPPRGHPRRVSAI
jgi:hypothetical protein